MFFPKYSEGENKNEHIVLTGNGGNTTKELIIFR